MIQKVTEEDEEGDDGPEDSIEEAEVVNEEEETEHNGRSQEEAEHANEDTGVDDQDMEEVDTNTVQIALPESSQFSSEATDFEPTSSKPKTAELRAKRIEKIQQDVTSGGVSGELVN